MEATAFTDQCNRKEKSFKNESMYKANWARLSRKTGEATEAGKITNLQNRHDKARPA